jgi:hypothetical protein
MKLLSFFFFTLKSSAVVLNYKYIFFFEQKLANVSHLLHQKPSLDLVSIAKKDQMSFGKVMRGMA